MRRAAAAASAAAGAAAGGCSGSSWRRMQRQLAAWRPECRAALLGAAARAWRCTHACGAAGQQWGASAAAAASIWPTAALCIAWHTRGCWRSSSARRRIVGRARLFGLNYFCVVFLRHEKHCSRGACGSRVPQVGWGAAGRSAGYRLHGCWRSHGGSGGSTAHPV